MATILRKRINNDIYIRWAIYDKDNSPINIERALSYKVVARPHATNSVYELNVEAKNNILDIYFPASTQKDIGKYTITLTYTEDDDILGEATHTIDHCDVFELIPVTCKEHNEDSINIKGYVGSFSYELLSEEDKDDIASRISGTSPNRSLNSLTDTNITSPKDGEVLSFDGNKWINTKAIDSTAVEWGSDTINGIKLKVGNVSKSLALANHTHTWTSITNKPLTEEEFNTLKNLSSLWELDNQGNLFTSRNVNIAGKLSASSHTLALEDIHLTEILNDLSDVLVSSPKDNDLLIFNGEHWINVSTNEIITDISLGEDTKGIVPVTIGENTVYLSTSTHTHSAEDIDAYNEGTLEAYGISNAYTKDEVDTRINSITTNTYGVTSVGLSMPSGLEVLNSPIKTSGTILVKYSDGYKIPLIAKQKQWDIAYADSHTHSNISILDEITPGVLESLLSIADTISNEIKDIKVFWSDIQNVPTTVRGMGISDVYNKTEIDHLLSIIKGSGSGLDVITSNSYREPTDESTYSSLRIQNMLDIVNTSLADIKRTVNGIKTYWYLDENGNLRTDYNAYSTKELSAYGMGNISGGGTGDLIEWINPTSNAVGLNAAGKTYRLSREEHTHSQYLTQHQDISHLASTDYVDTEVANAISQIPEVNLDPYALKSEIPTKVGQLENDVPFLIGEDIEGLATKEEVNAKTDLFDFLSHINDETPKKHIDSLQLQGLIDLMDWFSKDSEGNIYTDYNLYSTKELSAFGMGEEGSGAVGGLIEWGAKSNNFIPLTAAGKTEILALQNHKHTVTDITDLTSNYYDKTQVDAKVAGMLTEVNWDDINDKPSSFKPSSHTHTIANITGLQTELNSKLNATLKGVNNGLAELDSTGKVPSSQLPSYVDDVLEYTNLAGFPTTGETGKIYVAKDTNKIYRWSGTAYTVISDTIALGETSSTAYRGDRGKIAYEHSQTAHAPSNAQKNSDITKAEIETKLTGTITTHKHNAADINESTTKRFATDAEKTKWNTVTDKANQTDLNTHTSNKSNPHSVTKAQVGLGNVTNTSDANKPVSTAQQTALDKKEDLVNKKTTLTNTDTDYPTTKLLTTELNKKSNLASPTFTGTPKAPTAAKGNKTTQLATTAFVDRAIYDNDLFEKVTEGDKSYIKAKLDLFGVGEVAAFGVGDGSGGVGAGTIDIIDNLTTQTHNQALSAKQGYVLKGLIDNLSDGTVKSVGLTVPTGFTVSGSPITKTGTLGLGFASGYSLPTTAKQTAWDAKWNYNENTIKAVKVNNATTADKLGSSTIGSGIKPIYLNAGTATASTSTVGSATRPVYLNAGTITQGTYSLNKTVPSNAVFTDTTYSSLTAAEASTGTATTARTISAKVLADEINRRGDLRYLPLSGGKLTGDLEIFAANTDKFIKFAYNTTDAYAWRIGYLGTGSGNENRLAFQSAKSSGASYTDALSFGLDDLVGRFAVTPTVGNTKVSLEGHSHSWAQVTGKPTTFAPSAHSHPISDITNLQTTLNNKLETSIFNTHNNDNIRHITGAERTKWDGVVTDFAGLEIGGRNLLLNSDFSQGFDYYWEKINSSPSSNFEIVGTALKATFVEGRKTDFGKFNFVSSHDFSSTEHIIISAMIKGNGGLKIRFGGTQNPVIQINNDEYKKFTQIIPKSRFGNGNLIFEVSSGELFFDKLKLEKGNKPTDWTPAPEDQVSDWDTTDVNSFSFIKNKPTLLSQFTDNIGVVSHIANKANPHSVTKAQVGLSNVDNTSDLLKPISNAVQSALNGKLNLTGGTLSGGLNILTTSQPSLKVMYDADRFLQISHGGIKNVSPLNNPLSIGSESSGDGMYFSTGIGASYKEQMRINSIGNVGIGTTNPAYKLDVAGTGRFTGNLTAPTFTGALSGNVTGGVATNNGIEYLNTLSTVISAIGWYRVFISNTSNAYGSSVILNVNRSYSVTTNESYTFSINVASNGAISITQLSGRANQRIISKIRADYVNSGVLAVDIYYSSDARNIVYISGSGTGKFQAPTLVAAPTGTTVEFDTVNGVKSSLGFTGDLTGNASSATTATNVTLANRTTNASHYISFSANATGNRPLYTNAGLTFNPSTKSLSLGGNLIATGELTGHSSSDIRLKDNIKSINNPLAIINQLDPVTYNWNDKAIELNGIKTKEKKDYGLIAQDVEKIIPEVVGDMYDGEYKGIDYVKLVPILIGAVKELTKEIEDLKQQLKDK